MKRFLVISILLILMAACQSQPTFVDNGNPGQIKAIAFYDSNGNGVMDNGETGAKVPIAIAQEVSCPPTNTPNYVETDIDGVLLFTDLIPGKYCVFIESGFSMTTKLTQEVYVSSDQVSIVMYGVAEE